MASFPDILLESEMNAGELHNIFIDPWIDALRVKV